MRTNAAVLVVVLCAATAHSQTCTWSTVDDFVYSGSQTNSPTGIASHDSRLYVSGTAGFGPDTGRWIVRQGKGLNWATADDFLPAPAYRAHADSVAVDQSGTIYVGGGTESTAVTPWVVRVSRDNGATWSIAESLGTSAQARGLVAQKNGPVFAGGNTAVGGNQWHWLVRSSTSLGATWGLSDQAAPILGAAVVTAMSASDTNVYAAGYNFMDYQYRWQVRRLSSSGWSLVDDWTPSPGNPYGSIPTAVVALPNGVVITAGTYVPLNQAARWLIRRTSNSGATWTNVEERIECRATGLSLSRSQQEVLLSGRCPINGVETWVVYRSGDAGLTWTLSDSWTPSSSVGAAATAVGFDGDTAYAAGTTYHLGQRHWIVRKRQCSGGSGGSKLQLAPTSLQLSGNLTMPRRPGR